MREYQIKTVEARRFDIAGGVAPIEVEFHKEPSWAARLEDMCTPTQHSLLDGLALARLSARIALTGSAIPPISIIQSGEVPVALTPQDLIDLAFLVASFGSVPTEMDHSDGSQYLAFRSAIEQRLDLRHVSLQLRGGERQIQTENAIEHVSANLANYSLAFSQSPELSFAAFADLVNNCGRIFTFSRGADALLGASALASAYQISMMYNPILAIELAAGGAGAYVVLKFGGAVGKKVEQIIHDW